MPNITCKVEECKYNSSNYCNANQVDVCSCGCDHVDSSEDTACDTFIKRS